MQRRFRKFCWDRNKEIETNIKHGAPPLFGYPHVINDTSDTTSECLLKLVFN